jgi:hypothetical protein
VVVSVVVSVVVNLGAIVWVLKSNGGCVISVISRYSSVIIHLPV